MDFPISTASGRARGDDEDIVVVASSVEAERAVHRALAHLAPVIDELDVTSCCEALDLWGHPAALIGRQGTIEAVNEAWQMSTGYRGESTGQGVSHTAMLTRAASSSDTHAARCARAVENALKSVHHRARDPAFGSGRSCLVGYECDDIHGFIAACLRRGPKGLTWLSHVPLGPFLALADSREGRLRETFDGIPDGVCWLTPLADASGHIHDFVFVDLNRVACGALGMPREAIIGRRISQRTLMCDLEHLRRMAEVYERRTLAELEYELPPVEGQSGGHYHQKILRIGDELVIFHRSITEAVQTQRRLKDARFRHALAEREARVGLIDICSSGDELVLDEEALELFNMSSSSTGTVPVRTETLMQRVAAADAAELRRALKRPGTKTAFRLSASPERWLELNIPAQNVGGGLAVVQDVSDLIHAQREVHEGRRLLQEIVEGLADGVLLLDLEGKVLRVNAVAERILEAKPGQLEGLDATRWPVSFFDEGAREPVPLPPGLRVVRDRASFDRIVGRYPLLSGRWTWLEVSGRPLDAPDIGGLLVITDVSERVRAESARDALEARLRELQKMEVLGELAAGIAHDFGNLLTAMASAGEFLDGSYAQGTDEAEAIKDILDASRRGRELVGQMTRIGRPTTGRAHARLDVESVLAEAARWVRRELPEAAELHVHVRPNTPGVRAVEIDLVRTLVNLALNAAQALPSGAGEVRLEARPGDDSDCTALGSAPVARIDVSDNGEGMTEEQVKRAFEPFFTTKGFGTGLGLVTVKRTVMALGGAVRISSFKGQGTRVVVLLPGEMDEASGLCASDTSSTPRPV